MKKGPKSTTVAGRRGGRRKKNKRASATHIPRAAISSPPATAGETNYAGGEPTISSVALSAPGGWRRWLVRPRFSPRAHFCFLFSATAGERRQTIGALTRPVTPSWFSVGGKVSSGILAPTCTLLRGRRSFFASTPPTTPRRRFWQCVCHPSAK